MRQNVYGSIYQRFSLLKSSLLNVFNDSLIHSIDRHLYRSECEQKKNSFEKFNSLYFEKNESVVEIKNQRDINISMVTHSLILWFLYQPVFSVSWYKNRRLVIFFVSQIAVVTRIRLIEIY